MNHWDNIGLVTSFQEVVGGEMQDSKRVRQLGEVHTNQPAQTWLSMLLRRAPRQAPVDIVEANSDTTVAEAPAKV